MAKSRYRSVLDDYRSGQSAYRSGKYATAGAAWNAKKGGVSSKAAFENGWYDTESGVRRRGPVLKRNAGPGSKRKTIKRMKRLAGFQQPDLTVKILRGLKRHGGGPQKRNPMRYGTSYFVSRAAAIRYYRDYGYDNVADAVARKLREGEIHIGKPPLKAGQRLGVTDGGKRYEIIEQNPSNPTVYDAAGKAIGKFSRKAAKIAARVVGGRVGPTIEFPTKAALLKYAREHGLKLGSIRKVS